MTVISFPADAQTSEYAAQLDSQDELRSFREKFIFPTKASLKSKSLAKLSSTDEPAIYFCGNSLGLQPKATKTFLEAHLDTWACHAVNGHFTTLEGSPLTEWQSLAEHAAAMSSKIVGASPSEVSVQNTLTVNLHLLMASFYKPTQKKHKIILDWKAFPSDHYMFESQIRWHGFNPKESMLLVGPDDGDYIVSTEKILKIIDDNAEDTALILLPGIQYYTGQWFEMEKITAYAHSKGLVVGWDLAHAVGNVPLKLHDWDIDFAAWCNYKYMNCGPGGVGGLFVHEKHGQVDYSEGADKPKFVDRLAGWYGGDKATRFAMDNIWRPAPGASGWQLSTSSTVDITCLCASLSVFEQTSIDQIRAKSLRITGYLQHLLLEGGDNDDPSRPYRIITPLDPAQRGAQLSILLKPGLLPSVFAQMQEEGFLFDQRKPDVIRIAPAPLYNSYEDVRLFVERFKAAVAASS